MSNELIELVENSDLEPNKADVLKKKFNDFFDIAGEWESRAKSIVVTDESQTAVMKMAREGRLFLRSKRIEVENTRKQLKEQALREGKAIDGIANVLKALIVPIEEYLDAQEHFVENKRKAEEEARRIEAEKALREKEEREAREREAARIAEEKRVREENERLRREAAAREAEIERERKEAQAKADAERRAAEEAIRAEREKAAREAEEIRRQADEKAEQERREAAVRAKAEREEYERRLAEVKCPHCGAVFDSREHAARQGGAA